MAVLGIDTSCYRTSLALADEGAILAQRRRLLDVPLGGRGLQQSQGVFQHVQHIAGLCAALFEDAPNCRVSAVCASTRPRPIEGSYMPIFTVGEAVGRSIASTLGVPFYETTHQQGHLRAALIGQNIDRDEFLALHLSGGTTELLRVNRSLSIELLGGTEDLHAGQLVDRIGVMLGLPFPAGPALEILANSGRALSAVPTSNRGLRLSLSGAEAQFKRMLHAGADASYVASEVYSLLSRTIAKLIAQGVLETGLDRVLIAGGVAASALFRELLPQRLHRLSCGARLYFAEPELSGDNAAGVALIGETIHQRSESK